MIPISFQLGASTLLLVVGLVFLSRRLRRLQLSPSSEAPTRRVLGPPRAVPCPDVVLQNPDLEEQYEREADSTRRRKASWQSVAFNWDRWRHLRGLIAVPLLCTLSAAVVLRLDALPALSRGFEQQAVSRFSWTRTYAQELDRVASPPNLPLLQEGPQPGPVTDPDVSPAQRLFAGPDRAPNHALATSWLLALLPVPLILLVWWPLPRRRTILLSIELVVVAGGAVGVVFTGAAAAELSGARVIVEEVAALRRLPAVAPETHAERQAVKTTGHAVLLHPTADEQTLFELYPPTIAHPAPRPDLRAFRIGSLEVPTSAIPACEVYLRKDKAEEPWLTVDTPLLVAGRLEGNKLAADYPIVISPADHTRLYDDMTLSLRGEYLRHLWISGAIQLGWLVVILTATASLMATILEWSLVHKSQELMQRSASQRKTRTSLEKSEAASS